MSRHSRKGKGRAVGMFGNSGETTRVDTPVGFLGRPEELAPLMPPVPFAAREAEAVPEYQRAETYRSEMTEFLTITDRQTAFVMYAAVIRQMQTIRRAVEEAAQSELLAGEFINHVQELLDTYGRLHIIRAQMNDAGITDRDVMGY